MRRRIALTAAVAGAAALAGAGVAWWRQRLAAVPGAVPASWWSLQWDSPEGQAIAMAGLRGQPLLLNFWATWCPPCIEELPRLDAFFREHRAEGWQVLGLAVDQAGAVRAFLQRHPLAFPVGLAGPAGLELSRQLGNHGGLPFSVLFDRAGQAVERRLGQLQPADLQRWHQMV